MGTAISPFQEPAVSAPEQIDDSVETIFKTKTLAGNLRCTGKGEKVTSGEHSLPLGRIEAVSAALIPIKKSEEWWQAARDERRQIFAEQSKHIEYSLDYLPFIPSLERTRRIR